MSTRNLYVYFALLAYVVQPILLPIFESYSPYEKSLIDWIYLYIIVISSVTVMYIIIGEEKYSFDNIPQFEIKLDYNFSVLLIAILLLISVLMLYMKVGITTFVNIEYYPYKIAGTLFYLRNFIFPIFVYLIIKNNSKSLDIFLYITILFASFGSGSRLTALFLTMGFLFIKYRFKYFIYLFVLITNLFIATISRDTFLADWTGDIYKELYADNYENINLTFFFKKIIDYILIRIQGPHEFIHMFSVDLCKSIWVFWDECLTASQVYKMSDNSIGGMSFDFFGNIYKSVGGNVIYYFFCIIILALFIKSMDKFSNFTGHLFNDFNISLLINIFILLMIFEFRLHVLIYTLIFFSCFNFAVKSFFKSET
jgi:hypothetical protein